jgi:hypothetical protein
VAVDLDAVRRLKQELETQFQQRHRDHLLLRRFWHGKYWESIDQEAQNLQSLFRDLRQGGQDVGPSLKIVFNTAHEVCVKFQTFLAPLPMIRVPSDDPSSTRARNQATVKEECLYGLWAENQITTVSSNMGWFLPLMGDCFLGCIPDIDSQVVRMVLRSPEHAYPVPSYDLMGQPKAIIFAWKVKESVARREFPGYNPSLALPEMTDRQRRKQPDPEVEILEWSDDNEFGRWVGDQKIAGVEHRFGRNLWRQVKFIDVPGEAWGHGAVEQSIGRVHLGNVLGSLIYDAALANVFAPLVLEDPQKFSEEIPTGPGAVLAVNQGGKAYYLNSPQGSLLASSELQGRLDQSVKQSTSMPDVSFGMADQSIITGKAINELQGAGTGSLVEHVQGSGIGPALAYWNETALYILRRMFPDDTIYLQGVRPRSRFDLKPAEFAWKHKGKDIQGSLRNEIVFNPLMGIAQKVVTNLQLKGAGLVSDEYARDQVGIDNSEEMDEQIARETIDKGILGMIVQALQQDPSPAGAEQAEGKVAAYLTGAGAGPAPPPHPLLAGSAAAPAPAALGPGPQPPESVGAPQPSVPAATPGPQAGGGAITLSDAVTAFQGVQGVQGRVFLVGEIVAQQQTSGDIEVALTEGGDRATLAAGLPQFAGRLVFHSVDGEPSEPHVEVTPGAGSGDQTGSAEPALAGA